jgi:hypothetical protein
VTIVDFDNDILTKADVIKAIYVKLKASGFNPALLSVNMCLTCEGELSQAVSGYTNYVITHGNMLVNAVIAKKECIICHSSNAQKEQLNS